MIGTSYNPIKPLDLVPSIYFSSKLPNTIDISIKRDLGFGPIQIWIDRQDKYKQPYILSISLDDENNPKVHTLLQKTGKVFYFTINNKFESTFKYLGKSFERDKKKQDFLQTFFKANNSSSLDQSKLADMYAIGYGVKQNYPEAIRYYTLSTKQDKSTVTWLKYLAEDHKCAKAQFQLAWHLEQGVGIEKNLNEAVRYCTLSAKQKHQGAMFALATYYVDSQYDQINYKIATQLIERLTQTQYGKKLTDELLIPWTNMLAKDAPEFFLDAVEKLIEDASL